MASRTAVIAGVGPGLGESIARKFVDEGCSVGLFARSEEYLEELESDLNELEGEALAVPTDIKKPGEVSEGFEAVRDKFGSVNVLVNHASNASWRGLTSSTKEDFEEAWRTTNYGAFLCSKEAVEDMLSGGGTIIFTGATSAVRGRGGAVGFSSAKFANRGLAESLARELGPKGIHVAHVVIDGQILSPRAKKSDRDNDSFLNPDEIAKEYWHLVQQDKTSWTLELDLRPYVEEF